MTGVRFTELQSRPMEFLDFTSLTLNEFQQLVLPFETAFQTRMAAWRMDGKPRTARRFTVYKNCPLPTPTVSPHLTPITSHNILLLPSLPHSIPYRQANVRRRKDAPRVDTAARGSLERLSRFP